MENKQAKSALNTLMPQKIETKNAKCKRKAFCSLWCLIDILLFFKRLNLVVKRIDWCQTNYETRHKSPKIEEIDE